jgi:hypothetical protein
MPDVTYEIVQHDDGWAYKVDGVFSDPFEALAAAQAALLILVLDRFRVAGNFLLSGGGVGTHRRLSPCALNDLAQCLLRVPRRLACGAEEPAFMR